MASLSEDGDEFRRRRRTKNIALALGLVALVILFYFVSLIRLSGGDA